MAKYSLDYYNNQINVNALISSRAKFAAATAEDIRSLVEIVKSIELVGIDNEVLPVVLQRVLELDESTFTTEDLIWIARLNNFSKVLDTDSDINNVNHRGEIIIGDRKLDIFGEVVLETHYSFSDRV